MPFKDLITNALSFYKLSRKNAPAVLEKLEQKPEEFKTLIKDPAVEKDPLLKNLFKVLEVARRVEDTEINDEDAIGALTRLKDEGIVILGTTQSSGLFFTTSKKTAVPQEVEQGYGQFIQNAKNYVLQLNKNLPILTDPLLDEYVTVNVTNNAAPKTELKTEPADASKYAELKAQLAKPSPKLVQVMTTMMQLEISLEQNYTSALSSDLVLATTRSEMKTVHQTLSGIFSEWLKNIYNNEAKFTPPNDAFRQVVATQASVLKTPSVRSGMIRSFGKNNNFFPSAFYSTALQMLGFLTQEKLTTLQALVKSTPQPLFEIYFSVVKIQKEMTLPPVQELAPVVQQQSTLVHSQSS